MRDLRVIVMGPLQARDGHIVSQFFRQYLHLDETDRGRLLYAENMSDAEDALLLLGTILVDRHIGTQFLNDSRRLESDLLGCHKKTEPNVKCVTPCLAMGSNVDR